MAFADVSIRSGRVQAGVTCFTQAFALNLRLVHFDVNCFGSVSVA